MMVITFYSSPPNPTQRSVQPTRTFRRRGACPHAPEPSDILHFKNQPVWSFEDNRCFKILPINLLEK